MATQRLRVWFTKGERVRFISHLDVLRYWERAIRRAGLPLAYSQGFTPHPKLAFAGPLPVGFLAEAELVEVTLAARVEPEEFLSRLQPQTTPDLRATNVRELPAKGTAPQALLIEAEYSVELVDRDLATARAAVSRFLALEALDWVEHRGERTKEYDLRSVVLALSVEERKGAVHLSMRLRSDQELTGRPEPVVDALFPGAREPVVHRFTRTRLILDEPSVARAVWRKHGRFD